MRRKRDNAKRHVPVSFVASHAPFEELISYCVRGKSHPAFRCEHAGDHLAETVELHLDDVEDWLWQKDAPKEGVAFRTLMATLVGRMTRDHDLNAARVVYAIATESAFEILNLYLRHRNLFNAITPHRKTLPALFSIHPNTAKVMAEMFTDSRLGTQTDQALQARSRAYFVSDAPANIYARAVITSVNINCHCEPVSRQQKDWRKYDRQYGCRTVVLPLPKYVQCLDQLPFPISSASVTDYWRKGKEMILEEMPDFHERPEWRSYHRRRYKSGSKKGAIQHAIFKDILVALQTIAGRNNRRSSRTMVRS